MQLKQFKQINGALAAASCALVTGQVQAESSLLDDWQVDTAVMYYGETDRVKALEAVVNVNKDFGENHIFNGKLVYDALTGASANGAVAQPDAQTFTRPSGKAEYTIKGGDTPLDDTFRDTRVQINGQWTQPLGQNNTVTGGLHVSSEYDYLSMAINAGFARDFNKKNTNLALSLSYAFDSIEPEGGIPVAFSEMVYRSDYQSETDFWQSFNATRQSSGDDTKDTLDVIFGLTQIINRRWLVQLNLGMSQVEGYLTDPFKVVSVVDEQGYSVRQLYESRPDSRQKENLYIGSKYHFDHSILDLSYRFSSDDWGIDSHTLESRWRYNLSEFDYIAPHVRFYKQSSADFYRPFLNQQESVPMFASADYRIGQMSAYTVGLKYGRKLKNGHQASVRLEYYHQAPENSGYSAPGVLTELDLYPSLSAVILQFGYRF